MNSWFQSSDYSSKDLKFDNYVDFLDHIKEFDYSAERIKLDKLKKAKSDYCPFGFGINTEKENTIHLTYDFDDKGVFYQLFESYTI